MRVQERIQATGDVGVLTREEKERRGFVPAPVWFGDLPPLRWPEHRLIAEIGTADGDPEWAFRAVEAAKTAGFWAVKAQFLQPDLIASRDAPTYGQGIGQPPTQWQQFTDRRMDTADWQDVKQVCDEAGLLFFASVWDEDSAELALEVGCPMVKIGSADITHLRLLRFVSHLGVPVMLSTGGAEQWEIDRAVIELSDAPSVILAACTLSYPCQAQDANLRRIRSLQRLYPQTIVGYSDHCRESWIVGEAFRAGALFVEAHWTVTPGAGADHDFALHPDNIGESLPDGWNGDHWGDGSLVPMSCELPARRNARRSLAARWEIGVGDRWHEDDLICLRPGTGIPPERASDVAGRAVLRDYGEGELLDLGEMG